jgi:hypothetical protein
MVLLEDGLPDAGATNCDDPHTAELDQVEEVFQTAE